MITTAPKRELAQKLSLRTPTSLPKCWEYCSLTADISETCRDVS